MSNRRYKNKTIPVTNGRTTDSDTPYTIHPKIAQFMEVTDDTIITNKEVITYFYTYISEHRLHVRKNYISVDQKLKTLFDIDNSDIKLYDARTKLDIYLYRV